MCTYVPPCHACHACESQKPASLGPADVVTPALPRTALRSANVTSVLACFLQLQLSPSIFPYCIDSQDKMVLKLRLSRLATPGGAKKHHPRYNIVLAHARTARDSKPLEVLGTYNPIPQLPVGADEKTGRKVKDIKVDVSRAKYWLGVGAQPSDTVWRLLSMVCPASRW